MGLSFDDPKLWAFFDIVPSALVLTQSGVDENYGSVVDYNKGVELVFGKKGDDIILNTVWLFNERHDVKGTQYSGPLPEGVAFNQSRSVLKAALGTPLIEKDAVKHPLFGVVAAHLVYKGLGGGRMNLQFDTHGLKAVIITRI